MKLILLRVLCHSPLFPPRVIGRPIKPAGPHQGVKGDNYPAQIDPLEQISLSPHFSYRFPRENPSCVLATKSNLERAAEPSGALVTKDTRRANSPTDPSAAGATERYQSDRLTQ